MTTSGADNRRVPHVALVSCAGMGHIGPMTRLAAALSSRGSDVSFVSVHPTVTIAESDRITQLLSQFPAIRSLHLPLVALDPSDVPSSDDPFFFRMEAMSRSADRLPALLASSGTVSAVVIDVMVASAFVPVVKKMNLPCYVLFTSSAALFSLFAYFPAFRTANPESPVGDVDVSGVFTIPKASVNPFLFNPNHIFTTKFLANSRVLPDCDGLLINTFVELEPEILAALSAGRVVPKLPPVVAVGPLLDLREAVRLPEWLDGQPEESVVYVSFGNRTAMTPRQLKELAAGLEMSGCRFLWVVKTTKVDRDESGDIEEVIGEGYSERVKERGLVVNGWVEQAEALRHRAVGGFVSHCGWNSVTEAAMAGVRMLGWPRMGDQRVNGEVVRRSGLGVWMEEWSWEAEGGVVAAVEIAAKVREVMADDGLRRSAARVREEAKKAVGPGGSSDKGLHEFVRKLTVPNNPLFHSNHKLFRSRIAY